MDMGKTLEVVGALALVAAKHLADVMADRRRDARLAAEQAKNDEARERQLADLRESIGAKLNQLEAFLIGPDGRNGIREDMRKLERRFDAFEEREREFRERPVRTTRRRGDPK